MQSLWRAACVSAFTDADLAANTHICKTHHKLVSDFKHLCLWLRHIVQPHVDCVCVM